MALYNYSATVQAIAWTPSTYRMLAVPSQDATSTYPAQYTFNWPLNYLQSQLDFSINISQLLWGTADKIATVSASVFPTDLDIIYAYGKGGVATIWVSGGTQNQTYNIEVLITTQQSRIIPINVVLQIPGPGFTTGTLQYAIVQVPKSYVDQADDALNALVQQAILLATQALAANNPSTEISLTDFNGYGVTDYSGNSLVIS
jgi:hypothetical protein